MEGVEILSTDGGHSFGEEILSDGFFGPADSSAAFLGPILRNLWKLVKSMDETSFGHCYVLKL
jgi:hypothetical protein